MTPIIRQASHAGSWYTDNGTKLDRSLSSWLERVDPSKFPLPDSVTHHEANSSKSRQVSLPIRGCKGVIGPHAGYSYSGAAAAWAYKCIDTTGIKRVFILGPSHHVYLDGCALSKCDEYETPLGNLKLDKQTITELASTKEFSTMSLQTDEDEHSIEMHLPYIFKVFEGCDIRIIPILVGAIDTAKEQHFGKILSPYLENDENIFVVSSDFCHWGSRFSYTYYRPTNTSAAVQLTSRSAPSSYATCPIHHSIRQLDGEGISAISFPSLNVGKKGATQARDEFAKYIKETRNTVCGRHPIGVLLGALADSESRGKTSECSFTRYEQSSECLHPKDSSVSYASAYFKFT
ncbi:UPF0103-domain-containing protein [Violaceomyces palustris]|uniref:UPF0103-domain-containing protein n=1 Tax=Violaceomyces palustris TaxID=1673888 RepID=A0ACD0P2K2_9BASI|nr:UPF0103-domain-containing protein [Violaceomyces palustris]